MKFKLKFWHLLLVGLGAYYIYTQQVDKNLVPLLEQSVAHALAEKDSLLGLRPQQYSSAIGKLVTGFQLLPSQTLSGNNYVSGSGYEIFYDMNNDNFLVTIYTEYNQTCTTASKAFFAMSKAPLSLRGVYWAQSSDHIMSWDAEAKGPMEIYKTWSSPEVNPDPSSLPTEAQMKWACAHSDNVTAAFSLK